MKSLIKAIGYRKSEDDRSVLKAVLIGLIVILIAVGSCTFLFF